MRLLQKKTFKLLGDVLKPLSSFNNLLIDTINCFLCLLFHKISHKLSINSVSFKFFFENWLSILLAFRLAEFCEISSDSVIYMAFMFKA